MTTATDTLDIILQTDASGAPIRLEYVRGRLKVEASPASRHQKTIDRIRISLTPIDGAGDGCGCFSLADTLIRFPDLDASLKRPDIAIFCDDPPDSDEALDIVPAAVIEVISLGYEEKDLGPDGAPFYLACGVLDVVILDPRGGFALHYQQGKTGSTTMGLPTTIDLRCGCRIRLA